MRIAFFSYQFPPDTAYGGIATYARSAVRMLHAHGHDVEVFAASPTQPRISQEDGVTVHRVDGSRREVFPARIAPVFAAAHASRLFDVLEGPEWGADAREAIRLVPDIPLVIKLHIPTYLANAINRPRLTLLHRIRGYAGALKRRSRPFWCYDPTHDVERELALQADEVVSPSLDLARIVTEAWGLDPARVAHVPNPYQASRELLRIPPETDTRTVSYIGRLEMRKGVDLFAQVIPEVLRRYPDTIFRFIGSPKASAVRGLNMRQYLERQLSRFRDSIVFIDAVPLDEIPALLEATDICVFPSVWENFPNVCLEAMAAGRAIVASAAGGMAEMLDGGRVGRLVRPRQPAAITRAILELLENRQLRIGLGSAARARLLEQYHPDRIVKLQVESYSRAIARRAALGTRPL